MMIEYLVSTADWRADSEALVALRTRVFVEEQQVPVELEVDDMDPISRHFKANTADGELIGTARLLPDGIIGRMCVARPYRNMGVGSALLRFIIEYAYQRGAQSLSLNAQISALPFYLRHGFETQGAVFIEAGIEHQQMTVKLPK